MNHYNLNSEPIVSSFCPLTTTHMCTLYGIYFQIDFYSCTDIFTGIPLEKTKKFEGHDRGGARKINAAIGSMKTST